jgi:hypothetical protein
MLGRKGGLKIESSKKRCRGAHLPHREVAHAHTNWTRGNLLLRRERRGLDLAEFLESQPSRDSDDLFEIGLNVTTDQVLLGRWRGYFAEVALTSADSGPAPFALTAATLKKYVVPLVSPELEYDGFLMPAAIGLVDSAPAAVPR